jgi:hypothetical protein
MTSLGAVLQNSCSLCALLKVPCNLLSSHEALSPPFHPLSSERRETRQTVHRYTGCSSSSQLLIGRLREIFHSSLAFGEQKMAKSLVQQT